MQNTPPSDKIENQQNVIFNAEVHIQRPLEELPDGIHFKCVVGVI